MSNPGSETALELETIQLFKTGLEYDHTQNCYDEWQGGQSSQGRDTKQDVVLVKYLRPALEQLNPHHTPATLTNAITELTKDRGSLSLPNANREIYHLLRDGIDLKTRDAKHRDITQKVHLIDWQTPANNHYFLASQFWIRGEVYEKRPDLIVFVNGIPLVVIELKKHTVAIAEAYTKNLTDYRGTPPRFEGTIPQLFWYNALILLSNGSQSKIGSLTSPWEYFNDWKKIDDETEPGQISLETLIRGTCAKTKLLDLVQNFTLYAEENGKIQKLIAQNHQFLGVNNAIRAVQTVQTQDTPASRRLGVFWHTQGSGKSYSMQFFAQKVHRTIPGNWTFLILSDREDLDGQIYQNFAKTGAIAEDEKTIRAQNAAHLQQLLTADHRYIFTLIQKFRVPKGETYPELSQRRDIIVMVDEAHRSQYDVFAANLRRALPHAAFIGFTGTPLIAGEEEATRDVFGDYVSIYNFRDSIADQATVPLYYENRTPQLQLNDDTLNAKIDAIINAADLDEEAEARLEREFAGEYHLIVSEERLETIAADIVNHFTQRGFPGKAMVISIDRFTAVKMYDKVQHHWQAKITQLNHAIATAEGSDRAALEQQRDDLQATDMAVVISSSQNEKAAFAERGLDITPHRHRLAKEKPSLDQKFKDASSHLKIVFVCAMWITGFDAPACSTIYLDKPMRNHTLMQTIARANRVFGEKVNGLIVDYIGVFRNLKAALAIYGAATGSGIEEGDHPVAAKTALVAELGGAIAETQAFLQQHTINLAAFTQTRTAFVDVQLYDQAVEALTRTDLIKQAFIGHIRRIRQLYKAILPDPAALDYQQPVAILLGIVQHLKNQTQTVIPDLTDLKAEIRAILNEAIAPILDAIPENPPIIDLSQLDFDTLRTAFEAGQKHTKCDQLKNAIAQKLEHMVQLNRTRMNFYDRYQTLIDQYNTDSANVEAMFADLLQFIDALNQEDQRAIAENLDEEKLALFDLLTGPNIQLTEQEKTTVKQVVEDLLRTLTTEQLSLDWRKRQQARAAVRVAIEDHLDPLPKDPYPEDLFTTKCHEVYQHIYDHYGGDGRSTYRPAA